LECEFHQVTPAKPTLPDKFFQHHEEPLLQEVGTNATSPRSELAKEGALMKPAAEDEADVGANITTEKQLQFQIHLANTETEAMTRSSS
jgi:hypothetical protein